MLSPSMKTSRPWPVCSRAIKVLFSASAALMSAVVIGFHVFLLWQRVVDLSLFKPGPAIRWLATAALLLGLYRLHRQGASLIRGRNATVIWLLVLLLHASFWGPLADPIPASEGWTTTGLLFALPAITIILGGVFPTIRKLLARVFARSRIRDLPSVELDWNSQSFATRAGCLPSLACRPPPSPIQ